jgi:hypothetical protein
VTDGIANAGTDMGALVKRVNGDEVSSSDFLGTREFLKNNSCTATLGSSLASTATRERRRSISPISSCVESQLHAALSQRPVTAG